MSDLAARWSCKRYAVAAAHRIARELRLSSTVAQILARRGCSTPEEARRFLVAEDRHDPELMSGMREACELILSHVRRGSRIVVHGDYDVDGVSSTAILVEALRAVGADPSWHLPARLEGYGLSTHTVERLAAQGTGLLVTVDCGVTSTGEVDAARRAGVDVVVTDHHRPGELLPDCPVVHPALEPYPFAGLCAAAVAHKLSEALRRRAGLDLSEAERELDLVGLATVCDLVPLLGENRRLAREGLRALARTERPGLRALMRVAQLEPGELDERAVGFRLGPRLNAAGRLRRADAALELLLTTDAARAAEVADELDLLNRDRRDVETRILFAAEKERAEQDGAAAYVLAGEGWHPGVAGIVASRMAERHHRPCLVVAMDEGGGRGSGRSIPAYDLHAGLAACAGHLRRFGGHRAAAGFEIDPDRLDDFRRDFVRNAAASLSPEDLEPVQEVDAVVSGASLGLPLAEELRLLAPFGHGNPEPTLLVPASRVTDVRPMGEEAQHARFRLAGAGSRAEAVAFRSSPSLVARAGGEPCNAAVRLELNEWNGRVEPRVTLSALCPPEEGACVAVEPAERFWRRVALELDAALESAGPSAFARVNASERQVVRALSDRRGEGIAGVTGELLSSGEPVLVVCADAERRRASLGAVVAGLRRSAELPVVSWDALAADPGLARPFDHLVAIDPPPGAGGLEHATSAPSAADTSLLHLAWGPAEVDFARAVAREALDLRGALVEVYRSLRDSGGGSGDDLERLLAGAGPYRRSPAVCGRLLRVLSELGLVALDRASEDGPVACRVLAEVRTDLERSPAHRAYRRRLEEIDRYLAGEAAHRPGSASPSHDQVPAEVGAA